MIKKKFRFSYFYTILALLVVAGCITLHFAKAKITDYLQDYENTQPKYVAEKVFNEYYQTRNFEKMLSISKTDVSPAESIEDLIRYFEKLTEGKEITYSSVSTDLKDEIINYSVKVDGEKFSTFTIKKSELVSKYDFPLYEMGEIVNDVTPEESATIKAPDDAIVYINGIALDASYCIQSGMKTACCNYLPEDVQGITYNTYKIEGLLFEPVITVKSNNGESVITYDEKTDVYTAAIAYSESLKEEYSAYIIEAAEKYAAYMEYDGSFGEAAKYFIKGTTLYENLRTSSTQFAIIHTDYRFEDVKTGEFYQYDENTFSCRVSFTHVLIKTGSDDYQDYIDITYFLKKVDDKFLIYDAYNN